MDRDNSRAFQVIGLDDEIVRMQSREGTVHSISLNDWQALGVELIPMPVEADGSSLTDLGLDFE